MSKKTASSFDGPRRTAKYIEDKIKEAPDRGIWPIKRAVILGSGLGAANPLRECPFFFPYGEIIPPIPSPSVEGHRGELRLGLVGQEEVSTAVFEGRTHLYEGYSPAEVVYATRTLYFLGVKSVVFTNAVGGIRHDLHPGNLVVTEDHLNLTGQNPLVGRHDDQSLPRFPDMGEAYSKDYLGHALKEGDKAMKRSGFMKKGVYAAVLGPSFETPAEIRMYRAWGADVIGMSIVNEVIAARQFGMKCLGISCVANRAAGLGAPGEKIAHEEVQKTMDRAAGDLKEVLKAILPGLPD